MSPPQGKKRSPSPPCRRRQAARQEPDRTCRTGGLGQPSLYGRLFPDRSARVVVRERLPLQPERSQPRSRNVPRRLWGRSSPDQMRTATPPRQHKVSRTYRNDSREGTGIASRNCQTATGTRWSSMNRNCPLGSPQVNRASQWHTRLLGHAAQAVGMSQRAPTRRGADRSRQRLSRPDGAQALRERRPAVPQPESERSGIDVTCHGHVGCLPEGSWQR
jgi:hypothetical protein